MQKLEKMKDKWGYQVYQIQNAETGDFVTINPERGGIVTKLHLGGKEILYLNEEIYGDRERYIRGGIPILFPIVGKLENDIYTLQGKKYCLPIHGAARNFPWKLSMQQENKESFTFEFRSSQETFKIYPFEFVIRFTYILKNGALRILQEYTNLSKNRMSFSIGLHPYFKIPGKAEIHILASKLRNTITGEIQDYGGSLPFEEEEFGYLFLNNQPQEVVADFREYKLNLSFGNAFKYLLVWYVKAEKFICIEPWSAGPNAMNTKEDLLWLEPEESLKTWVEIKLEK